MSIAQLWAKYKEDDSREAGYLIRSKLYKHRIEVAQSAIFWPKYDRRDIAQ